MSYEKAKELLTKYKAGNCTASEKDLVEKWLFQYQSDKLDLSDERIEEIGQEMWLNLPKPPIKVIENKLWLRITAAAVILMFLSVSLYFLVDRNTNGHHAVVFTKDVIPGGNKAILTLANGEKITLTGARNGQLANDGNASISKTAEGEIIYRGIDSASHPAELAYNSMTVPRSGQYHLILSDGTQVWLNAASSIKYPIAFAANERKVEITGEAYFEVAHNAAKPFKVVANGQTVEVLGTHFNVNAYTNEPVIRTTLLEGSVKVSSANQMAILVPGQQAQVIAGVANNNIIVHNRVDVDEAVAWKNGLFEFKNASMESIMRQTARWYDVEIVYDGDKTSLKTFTGSISRNSKLSQLLEILSYTGNHFEIEGRKIIVKSN